MTTKITTKTYEIRQSVTVRTRPTLQGFVAWMSEVDGPGGRTVTEGTCREGDEPTWPGDPTPRREPCFKEGQCYLVLPETLERVRTEGFEAQAPWVWDDASTKPYTVMDDPTCVPVLAKFWDHTLLGADGHLPVGQHVDYVDWNMHNLAYDLKRAAEILRDHPHVLHMDEREVEYYNREGGKTDYIDFWWTPDVATYRKARAWLAAQEANPERKHLA